MLLVAAPSGGRCAALQGVIHMAALRADTIHCPLSLFGLRHAYELFPRKFGSYKKSITFVAANYTNRILNIVAPNTPNHLFVQPAFGRPGALPQLRQPAFWQFFPLPQLRQAIFWRFSLLPRLRQAIFWRFSLLPRLRQAIFWRFSSLPQPRQATFGSFPPCLNRGKRHFEAETSFPVKINSLKTTIILKITQYDKTC